jgi:hypothetical protein
LANNKKPLVSQNPAFNFALLFVLLQPILSAILQIPLIGLIAVFEKSKHPKKHGERSTGSVVYSFSLLE